MRKALLVVVLVVWATACATLGRAFQDAEEVRWNFARVNDWITRSGQPATPEELQQLVDALQACPGGGMVLNLRGEGGKLHEREAEHLARAGIPMFSYRLSTSQVPAREDVIEILKLARFAMVRGRCVHVHCQGGADRSGMIVGLLLVELFDYSRECAIQEALPGPEATLSGEPWYWHLPEDKPAMRAFLRMWEGVYEYWPCEQEQWEEWRGGCE